MPVVFRPHTPSLWKRVAEFWRTHWAQRHADAQQTAQPARRPMAILRNEADACKPVVCPGSGAKAPQAPAAPRVAPPRGATLRSVACKTVPSGATPSLALALQRPSAIHPTHAACMTAARAAPVRSIARPNGFTLCGRMADVCAELERLALQEEQFLRAS